MVGGILGSVWGSPHCRHLCLLLSGRVGLGGQHAPWVSPWLPVTPHLHPKPSWQCPLSQGRLCLGGEMGRTGLKGVPGPGMAAAPSCPRWLSSPAGVTHPRGVATVTGHRARRLGSHPRAWHRPAHTSWSCGVILGGTGKPVGCQHTLRWLCHWLGTPRQWGGLVPMGAETGGGPYHPPLPLGCGTSAPPLRRTPEVGCGCQLSPAAAGGWWPACSCGDIPAPWVLAVPGMWGDAPSVPPPCLTPPARR